MMHQQMDKNKDKYVAVKDPKMALGD